VQVDNFARFQYVPLLSGETYLRWRHLFEFLISQDGSRIECHELSKGSREALDSYLLGQVLSFALLRRSIEPLHCTAVLVEGKAIGFVGDCGYGKSSLAAAFLQVGHRMVTDDLLVARPNAPTCSIFPGPPRIKLFPEVAKVLLGSGLNGSRMNKFTSKLVIPLSGSQSSGSPAILKVIYVLNAPHERTSANRVLIRRLSQRRAFVELTKNTFNTVVTDRGRLKCQFALAHQIASLVPLRRLAYARRLELLPAVREAILSDLEAV
jgi:hypothetical protein